MSCDKCGESRYWSPDGCLICNRERDKWRSPFDKLAADSLAYEVAKCIERGVIGTRSGPADALLDYLAIGQSDGAQSVPEWVERYESKQARK
jgi:hypothetical protein